MREDQKLGIPLQVRLTEATREALAELAERDGRTVAGMARVLIQQGVIRRRARADKRQRQNWATEVEEAT